MTLPTTIYWTLAIAAAYLIGAIPFGYLIARAHSIDIRLHGSGNIGATNVRRVLGKAPGNAAFALDLLKGAIPTIAVGLSAGAYTTSPLPPTLGTLWLALAVAAVIGHMFPIYLRFKGGKGVATGFGAMLALWPHTTIPAIIAFAAWYTTLRLARMVSLASCAAAAMLPVALIFLKALGFPPGSWLNAAPFIILTAILAALVQIRHLPNIRRIIAGTEPRIGAPKRSTPKTIPPNTTT